MNKFTSLFLIVLLVSVTSTEFVPKSDFNSVLAEIDNHHFGNTILSAISVQLSTEAPIEQVSALLTQVTNQLKNDQGEADKRNQTEQAGCNKEIAQYNENIDFHSRQLAAFRQKKANNEQLKATAQSELAQTNADLTENAAAIKSGTETRARNHQEWQREHKEHTEAIAAIDEATVLIQHLKTGTSFVQLKNHFSRVTGTMEAYKHKHALWTPVIQAMAQLANRADQATVKKILDLLANIRANLEKSLGVEQKQEEDQVALWKTTLANLLKQKASLLAKKRSLEANIVTYTKIIEESQQKIEEHSAELEENRQGLKEKTEWCEERSATYLAESAERARELDILRQLQQHFEKKVAHMKEYLKKRVNK